MKKENETAFDCEKLIKSDTVLLFDMDGTLVDTNYANFLSYKNVIETMTGFETELIYIPSQRFNRSVLRKSIPHLTQSQYEKIIQEKERNYPNYLHETKLITNVAEILDKYSKSNKTILVTNCRKDRVFITLNYFGLTEKFSNIFYRHINGDKTRINKYENAIAQLNISVQSVVVFENEKKEIDDAIKIGVPIENIINL